MVNGARRLVLRERTMLQRPRSIADGLLLSALEDISNDALCLGSCSLVMTTHLDLYLRLSLWSCTVMVTKVRTEKLVSKKNPRNFFFFN